MHFEHEGRSLWCGTSDAPGSEGAVQAGTEITITVGVSPVDASNKVELLYRVNQGPMETVAARWLRNDPSGKAQYFRAHLPAFRAGDTVEYIPICRCAGRQVPSPDEAQQFPSSIRFTEAVALPSAKLTRTSTVVAGTGLPPLASPPAQPTSASPARPSLPVNPPVTGGPVIGAKTAQHRVEGRIFFDHGLPAGGITVRLYNRGFGGADMRLGEITTDAQGGYVLPYGPGGKAANIEVRVVDAKGKEIPLSATKFNADKHEVLNLVAPASIQPLAPEYQRLSGDLVRQLGDLNKLAEARENTERPDLTLLHQATGWDARLIALTATAVKASADTGIPQDALYALFRAGLPTDQRQLAWASSQAVEKALGKAKEVGIVSLSDQQIAGAKAAFEKFARTTRLAARAPGALSSISGMLAQVGLGDDTNKFVDLYFEHRGTPGGLWEKAKAANISEANISKLKLQGKLAYLTLNNANLAASLQQEIGSAESLAQLADKDLYSAEAWKTRLNSLANNNEEVLKTIIPPAYAGEKTADRLEAYAADLARKVRLSFPTRIVGRMIEKDDLRLDDNHDALKTPVRTFLQNAEGLGFELGRTPMNAFIKQNQDKLFQGIAADKVKDTTQSVKTVQRLYQTTPTDESLKVLFDQGFKSAYDVVAFPYEVFLDRFGPLFPSREEARLVYRKAQQVSVVTPNVIAMAKQLDSAPPVYAISPPAAIRENAKNELIKHYPTMESLFGSLDFCECEHCRSVLSPAAYFVDLLQFLDPNELVWKKFLDDWKKKHNGKAYDGPEYKFKKPYDALVERRPDLPHLPLTCENTHTALPYIDVVNEILEYYVANDKLDDKAVNDTGEATTPELLAEPQNVIPEAYDALKEARYPLTLPFDLPIETVRRFCDHFETPLWQVLEVFRPADDLFPPVANPKPYYRAAIFAEYLGISPAEYGIFTDSNPLAKWFELYGITIGSIAETRHPSNLTRYATEAEALAALKSAKTLARRLGVSYKELTDLVRTGFVNPRLDALVILRKLGLDADDVFRYKKHLQYQAFTAEEQAAFEKRLDDLTKNFEASGFNARTWLGTAWQNGDFNQVLVLADPNAGCNFDLTMLRYADGTDADALVFLKINLFIRLWKKLGWTMEETDRALQVFLPKNSLPLTAANLGAALKTALLYLAHLKALDERVKVGKNSRLKLLTLWSNLLTTGKNPLYAQLFLTRSVLKNDPVFDDPLGNYLSKAGIFVKDHLQRYDLALQAALNLTADEVGRIFADAGKGLDTAELSLENVSLLYRYGLLAKALKLPTRDLIALKALSGLDPFKPLTSGSVSTLADDHPFSQTLGFVEVAEKVKGSGFRVEDLDYLLRHQFDPVGKYRPNPDALLALVKTLAAEIRRIQAEHAVPDDPASLTDDLLRQKIALVFPPDVVETFLGMWTGTAEYEAIQKNVPPTNKLDPATFTQEPAIRVSYNEVGQEQRLTYRGVLLDKKKTELNITFPLPMVGVLLEAVQGQAKSFFKKYLEKSTIGGQAIGFFEAGDFDLLFAPIPDGLAKREKLTQAFLPYLQQRLTRQLVVQMAATSLNADPALTEALLTSLLTDPSQPGKPLLGALASAGERGISAAFFASTDGTGAPLDPLDTKTVAAADTAGKPAGTNSARFEGYLEVPAAGAYRFFTVFGKKDAEAELRFAHLPDPLLRGKAANDGAEISQFVELKPGVPYRFSLDVRNLGGGDIALLVQGESLPKDSLARLTLYPQTAAERFLRAQVLLAKTLQLIQGLGLSEREVRYLLTHATDFDNLNLSKLPTREAEISSIDAEELFGWFLRLADYARLKRDLASGTDDLINVIENARYTHSEINDAEKAKTAHCEPFARLTRRDAAIVRAMAEKLGFAITVNPDGNGYRVETLDLAQEKGIQRIWEVLQVVEKLGVPVEALVRWPTPNPDFGIARDLKNTVKARYEPENWQRIAQSIFDKLRQRQRDALIAYIIHRHGSDRLEQLFEYFLIDPGMEPVVQTSRLRLAISSVQLFIQRCLLNLEKQVHPSAINSKHWQWMKHYRVWEANRKIFLFPENWLEPEFRDDKTHLFQELESALLQGDVSNGLVEDAFFNYLKKLEELARLEIVSMYCEEKPLDPASNTLHVIGRTYNLPHKYFYRRYAHQMWTPWEPVTAEIEGDHIVAVVWRERLHLFWVTFLEKAKQDTSGQPIKLNINQIEIPTTVQKEVEVQLNWCEYFQGQWTTRESSGFGDPIRAEVAGSFDRNKVFIHVSKEEEGEERAVNVLLSGALDSISRLPHAGGIIWVRKPRAFRVVSKNSQPEPGFGPSKVTFVERTGTEDGKPPEPTQVTEDILRQGGNFSLLTCGDPFRVVTAEIGALISPFFYQDNQHTFFVEPSLTETTIEQWEEWVITTPRPDPKLDDDVWWKDIPIEPTVPAQPFPIDLIGPIARFKIQPREDWVINPATVFQFDGRLVDRGGGLGVEASATIGVGEVAGGGVLVASGGNGAVPGNLMVNVGGLNVVGGGGLNSVTRENLNAGRGLNLDFPSGGVVGRSFNR